MDMDILYHIPNSDLSELIFSPTARNILYAGMDASKTLTIPSTGYYLISIDAPNGTVTFYVNNIVLTGATNARYDFPVILKGGDTITITQSGSTYSAAVIQYT